MKETDCNIHSGEIYYVGTIMEDGNVAPLTTPQSEDEGIIDLSKSDQRIRANRPAVVISRNECNKDSVLMAFLTRCAIDKSGRVNSWYKKFSPKQVNVNFTGNPATVLCSHVTLVNTDNLVEFMGEVTQDELTCIVKAVQESGEFDNILPSLYQPENIQPEM